jgi:DNA-binding response OmpR family regulator
MDFSHLKNKKVLIVDDFANVRKSVKSQFMDLGIAQVYEAHDGDSATKAVKENSFDLVLCDYNLGKGRDGARLLEEWRSRQLLRREAIFVLITGETSRDIVLSALEFHPDDYLAKPFTMEVLANRLGRWFDRHQALLPMLVSIEKKDWEAVAKSAMQIIEGHPRYRGAAQKWYVEALIQQKHFTQAENFLYGLLDKRYLSWAQTELHHLDLLQNKYEAAEVGLIDVANSDPNMIEAYDFLSETLAAQDKTTEQQEWLEKAIARAPRNIDRQKKLAHVAQKNLDFARASTALRDVVNMSVGTMHENVGMFFTYIKNLQLESQAAKNEQRKRDISKEIASINRRMNERYHQDINARLFSKTLPIQQSPEPAAAKFTKVLNEIYRLSFEQIEQILPETALIIAETFYSSERFNDADEMVKQFKKRFRDNASVVQQLDELQAEPVSLEQRQKAKTLNLKGIELYKNKDYQQSIRYFREAMDISPRHPGIILNFVQSHLLQMKAASVDAKVVSLCLEYIDRLNYLPEDHYQYERFAKLKKNLQALSVN